MKDKLLPTEEYRNTNNVSPYLKKYIIIKPFVNNAARIFFV